MFQARQHAVLWVCCLLTLLPLGVSARPNLQLCSDINLWFPFTFVEDRQVRGLHVDIVSTALDQLGWQAQFTPMPWKRCLQEAEQGRIDAIVTASYQAQRARYLFFPADAAHATRSHWRVTQVEYVLVTLRDSSYQFNGDLRDIPQPARAPYGYSIADDLAAAGLRLDLAPGDENNFRKLLRDRSGVVVTIPEMADLLMQQQEFARKLKRLPQPIKSKSYFLSFSRAGRLDAEQRQAIWDQIVAVREDRVLMSRFSQAYSSRQRPPVAAPP